MPNAKKEVNYLEEAKKIFTDWWNDDYLDFCGAVENLTRKELEKFCLYIFKITRSPDRKKKEPIRCSNTAK